MPARVNFPEILPDACEPWNCLPGALTAFGRAPNLALACGVLAPLDGKQAAAGQTARLRLSEAPDGAAIWFAGRC
jgi:hypothetical protein